MSRVNIQSVVPLMEHRGMMIYEDNASIMGMFRYIVEFRYSENNVVRKRYTKLTDAKRAITYYLKNHK